MESHSHDILSTKFDGKNYLMWEFHFRIFVQGKSLFGILNGSTTEPNEDKEKHVSHANNAHVISWILNSVHSDVALSLRPFNLAAEMWKHLKKVYSQCNHTRDFELEHTLSEYKHGDKDIQSYYSGLMAIWSEQDQSFGGNLSSTSFKEVMLERKKTRVVQFLMKLRPDFEPIRANIINRENLSDIDVIFGELICEETCINTLASMDSFYTIDAAINICNYSKKLGHIILKCNRRPNTRQTKNKAYQASEAYVSQEDITPSSLDPKALQKMIQDSVAAALPGAISSALTVAYPESGDREGDHQGS
ncbi:hypothetical protein KY290_021456 [Solanum tuberosum]|uniref:Retrotransposon Copia-like N-terminal domain-containing protein n=1 Tax=Solanum tuberosum TaxID=4113 RepID=A0ABQ7V2L4_SOLTU|nr:hypothetical protein KY289_020607 [Solanum tuberosum]KAH0757963.1 hypothetical protein KY290_021456 [Solanum tuberosum]